MNSDDILKNFIDKLKSQKSDAEVADYLATMIRAGSAELYLAMAGALTEEDMDAIEKIPNDDTAMKELEDRFRMRTGMTADEFVDKIKDEVAKEYLSPTS